MNRLFISVSPRVIFLIYADECVEKKNALITALREFFLFSVYQSKVVNYKVSILINIHVINDQ